MASVKVTQYSKPPEVRKESDWIEMQLPFNIGSGRTLYSGLEDAERLRLRLFKRLSDGHIIGRAWFGPGSDGPPGHAHGGVIAYILDEAMGSTGWGNDYPVVAATLQFQYMRMTPLLADVVIESKIVNVTAKRITLEAEIRFETGETCVKAQGEFAILTKTKGERLADLVPEAKSIVVNPNLKWAKDETN